jgi:hypothetical protein
MAVDLTNLVAWHDLENATDASGNGRDLTNNNTVTFTTGKVDNAGTFAKASSQWLSRAYEADLNISGGDFTVAGWVNRSSGGTFQHVVGMGWDETLANNLYVITLRSDNNRFLLQWYNGGYQSIELTTTTISNGTWYFFCLRRSGSTMSIGVNNGTPATAAGTLQTITAGTFGIGRGGSGASAYLDGQVDSLGIWKGYALTDTEVTELYNGGNGVKRSDIGGATPLPSGFLSFF